MLVALFDAAAHTHAQDLVAYCEGAEDVHMAGHERTGVEDGACPFFASGWPALAVHPALAAVAPPPYCLRDVTPVHTPELRRVVPPRPARENDPALTHACAARRALSRDMNKVLLCPPGALTRLHVQEHATHAWLAQARRAQLDAQHRAPDDAQSARSQLEGATQVVLYAPSAGDDVYGGERVDGQSSFDPFTPDFAAFPRARRGAAHTAVLRPGDTLVVPAGWWLTWRALAPGLLLQRNWVSRVNAARFDAALQARAACRCACRTALARC